LRTRRPLAAGGTDAGGGVREQLQREVGLKDLFEQPVLTDFCTTLQEKNGESDHALDELTKSLEALKRLSAEEIDNLIA
ncbi:pyoverdine sidechain peptide synthetase II, D-Asp-L-Thr component, partial [Pseudomonas amygdali pv. mori str. 301020]